MDVSQTKNWQIKIQKFGGFLSSMVMPNIGAFIAKKKKKAKEKKIVVKAISQ